MQQVNIRGFNQDSIFHLHLGNPINRSEKSTECYLPPECFIESDFLALFEPSGKVQGPKFRDAIKSLRLAKLKQDIYQLGFIPKIDQAKETFNQFYTSTDINLDDPTLSFSLSYLSTQIEHECVFPDASTWSSGKQTKDSSRWGGQDGTAFSNCLSLIGRINTIINSAPFNSLFNPSTTTTSLIEKIKGFTTSSNPNHKLLRIDLSGIPFEYKAREIIANCIGRALLNESRNKAFSKKPVVVFLDEAHNFIGKSIGNEDTLAKLDAFELIAKEGRKFGLNICLATQRPRDITEGVLSQLGTLIVHRLTNDRDREIVERACGEIDKAASDFLPSLQPGEAIIIGNDFPIPLTINIKKPTIKPNSEGANFQKNWA